MDLETVYQAIMTRIPADYLTLTQTLDAAYQAACLEGQSDPQARMTALTSLAQGITALAEMAAPLERAARQCGPQHEVWKMYHLACAVANYGGAVCQRGPERLRLLRKAQQFVQAVAAC